MKTIKPIRVGRALLLLLAIVITLPVISRAQSLSLVPAEVDQNFQPGKPFQLALVVSNGGSNAISAKVEVTDLWYDSNNQKTFGAPGSSPRSAANWIEAVPRQIEIPAHSSGKVEIIVSPPASAVGGYYATVFVESKPELVEGPSAANQNKAVFANMRLGSLILLNAEGTGHYEAKFEDATLQPGGAHRDLQVTFRAANTGNTHIFPQPRLAILDARHQVVARAQGEMKRLLPGQSGDMKVTWSGTLEPGNYTAVLTVAYGPDKIFTQELPFAVSNEAGK